MKNKVVDAVCRLFKLTGSSGSINRKIKSKSKSKNSESRSSKKAYSQCTKSISSKGFYPITKCQSSDYARLTSDVVRVA